MLLPHRRARDSGRARVLFLAVLALVLSAAVPARVAAAGRTLTIRGIRMYVEIEGSGPPLLLLHGGAGNGMQFEKQRAEFARHHRLIIPDARAQGRSTDRPGPLTYHDMAEDVAVLLDSLGVRRTDIMGWSDGGNIGLDLAIHHPRRVVHLVTFGANFAPDGLQPADVAWNRTATADSFGEGMRTGWTALNPEPANYAAAMNKILEMWRTLPRFTPAELGRIRARVLVCAGEHDVIRAEHSAALARMIRGAELWTVPGASHGAMLERPDLVNPRVLAFLARGPRP
ncbi:MAG: alpha/beta hydrolase [Candidatus Eisenbacteria bacterium]